VNHHSRLLYVFLVLFILILPMGPLGIEGFSRLSGVDILSGIYIFKGDRIIIQAIGRKKGMLWEVRCLWLNGLSREVWTRPLSYREI